ncbi:desulfoferrodoxin family protein [Magnetofaba australis]|nr:desulfoferrodoxin family protein [Magnetofaba australis]
MISRRALIQAAAVTGVGVVASAAPARAMQPVDAKMAGGVYYTAAYPGRWSGKAASHAPRITVTPQADGAKAVEIVTEHKMHGYKHYIVKHVLLDANYGFLDETVFNPESDEAKSTHTLPPGYTGPVYALSMCNLHDVWLSAAQA